MTAKRTLTATACFASLCGALYGQTGEKTANFQYFVNGEPGAAKVAFAYTMDSMGKPVTGKPFSGTEERETLQVLGDGTRIDKKDTNTYYRDAQGRTRIERDNGATVTISDPVAGISWELSTANKTARKMVVSRMVTKIDGTGTTASAAALDKMKAELETKLTMAAGQASAGKMIARTNNQSETMVFTHSGEGALTVRSGGMNAPGVENAASEDLGTQVFNGVPAKGTRSTITISAGQIGNDREIKVVSERWVSEDLGMLVKSSNKDPRFGETTYQLTNILQGAPDPTLFTVPSDFNVNGLR